RGRAETAGESATLAHLRWDPIRPLAGAGDWLARLSLAGARRVPRRVARRFGPSGFLIDAFADSAPRRLALIDDLLVFARDASRPHDPAVPRLLERERALLRLASAVAPLAGGAKLERALATMRRSLYPYQVEGVARFLSSGRLLLADDM